MCLFGKTKRRWRRQLGTKKLSRRLYGARAAELLVANLDHEAYVQLVYDGDLSTMAARFGAHWAAALEIRKARSQAKQPRSMRVSKKTLRDPDFLDRMIRATMCELGDPKGQ